MRPVGGADGTARTQENEGTREAIRHVTDLEAAGETLCAPRITSIDRIEPPDYATLWDHTD